MINVIKDTARALSLLSDETHDTKLQDQHYVKGKKYPFLNSETNTLILYCTSLIYAFFSIEAYDKFFEAINSVKPTNDNDQLPLKYQMNMDMKALSEVTKRLSDDLTIFFVIKKILQRPLFK